MLDMIPGDCPIDIVRAAKEQDLLGVHCFIEGRIIKGWGKAQQLYYVQEYLELRRTGLSGATMVIQNVLRYCREQ